MLFHEIFNKKNLFFFVALSIFFSPLNAEEDTNAILKKLNSEKWNSRFMLFLNRENIGQNASIDKMYKNVNTEYIFHCEEDWEFYKSGFIEDSLKVLETQPKRLR